MNKYVTFTQRLPLKSNVQPFSFSLIKFLINTCGFLSYGVVLYQSHIKLKEKPMSINTDYQYRDFFLKMEEKYQKEFSKLAIHYGNYINTLNINAGKTLYTRHDFDVHCINIYQIIDDLFIESFNFLTPHSDTKNIFKLYLAILLHDVGMTDFNINRDAHSKKSVDYVMEQWENSSSPLHNLRVNNILNQNDIYDICLMILAHSDIKDGSIDESCNGLSNPKFADCRSDRIIIMAAILRLADELDCSASRLGDERRIEQLDQSDPEQKKSLEHWDKLHCISRVYMSNEDNRYIVLELNDYYVDKYSDKDRIFTKYLPEIVRKVQRELDSINQNVFYKSYCIGLPFKAAYVKINTQKYRKEVSNEILYNYARTSKTNITDVNDLNNQTESTKEENKFIKNDTDDIIPDRKPSDSTHVTMRSSVSDFLRVDPFSNKSIFWEKDGKPGMFYDYALDNTQSVKGRITLNHNEMTISADKLDAWVTDNWLSNKDVFIHILVGYAGCGKSTFVNHILNTQERGRYSTFWNFYDIQEYSSMSQDSSMDLYLKDNLCYNIAKRLKSSRNKKALLDRFKKKLNFFSDLAPGFSCNIDILIAELEKAVEEKNYKSINIKDEAIIAEGRLSKQVPYLALTYLWNASIHRSQAYTVICVFDGLDIVDDPKQTVKLIKEIFKLMKRYRKLKNQPDVKLIITCRKFTLSLLETSSGDVSFEEIYADYKDSISFLDISTLYQVSKVLKYKAKTICIHPDLLNLKKDSKADRDKLAECKRIAELPEEIADIFDNNSISNETLSFSKIVNHNLRSASSLYHTLFSQSDCFCNLIKPKKPNERICYKGFFIHKICYELNIKKIWKNMGYGGHDNINSGNTIYGKEDELFPTTLSRMILTKLYRNPDKEISLFDLYNSFSWMPVLRIKKGAKIDDIPIDIENKLSPEYFAECIADMLIRSSSHDDEIKHEGIWRRPLYFGSQAISATNISDLKYIYRNEFISILEQQSINTPLPTFKIAECGEEFIDTFAIHFEFNAVRFCNTEVPLWMVEEKSDFESIANRVYNSVARCMEKQIWLASRYSKTHDKKYIDEDFHPQTNWRKRRPQLHIIRVVFSHIAYLDAIREQLWKGGKCNTTDKMKIQILNDVIGKYLNLLAKNIKNLKIDANSGMVDGKILGSMLDSYDYVKRQKTCEDPYVEPIKTNF